MLLKCKFQPSGGGGATKEIMDSHHVDLVGRSRPFRARSAAISVTTWACLGMPWPAIVKSDGDIVSYKGQQYIQRRVSRYSVERRLVRTVSPLAHSHGEVVVLASTCHDSVMVGLCAQVCLLNFVALVFLATAVILLANQGELYKSYSTVAWDLWQLIKPRPWATPSDLVYLLP